jgi:DtxR family Mn-dependent transcriptional regulator
MNTHAYDPKLALLVFLALSMLAFLVFRPNKGWFFLIKNSTKSRKKIVVEDILKLLYHSENSVDELTSEDLCHQLKFNNRLILKSIEEMQAHNLIQIQDEVVSLTKSGTDYALRMVRAHRLWEKFLSEKTGFDKLEWHHIAEQKEHELTEEDTQALANELGNPKFDPHGDPIPTDTGKIASIEGEALSDLPVHTIGRIIHIKDEPNAIYKQILAENIHIGSQIRIIEKTDKRVIFHSEGEEFILAPVVAKNITLSVLEKDHIIEDDIARLSSLKENESATIIGISKELRGDGRRRLLDLGFVKGADVKIDLLNPLGDPVAFLIKGTAIALRKTQASKILITKK